MLPAEFVWVEEFAVTPNGKIDMTSLPALVPAQAPESMSVRRPAAELEAVIAEMVAEVLGVPAVGPADNFIFLGGDSLLAARLMVRISDRFDIELALRSIFERPTVAELADEVLRLTAAESVG
jgi:acyl carrier protein